MLRSSSLVAHLQGGLVVWPQLSFFLCDQRSLATQPFRAVATVQPLTTNLSITSWFQLMSSISLDMISLYHHDISIVDVSGTPPIDIPISLSTGLPLFIILIFMGFSMKSTIQRAWGTPMTPSWNPPNIHLVNDLFPDQPSRPATHPELLLCPWSPSVNIRIFPTTKKHKIP